jgi:phytoene synthase
MIEARIFDLYDDPMPDGGALEAYLGHTRGTPVQLACLILAGGADARSGTAAGHAAMATGLAWMVRNLPKHAARGQSYIPAGLLARHGVSVDALREAGQEEEKRAVLAELAALTRRHLADTRAALEPLPRALYPAFAPCALVEPILKRSTHAADPFREFSELSPFVQQWRIWRGARGRF